MVIRKPKLPQPVISEHLQAAQKATDLIESCQRQLRDFQSHRDEVEAKLRDRSAREADRNERRAEASAARDAAREHFEQTAVEAEIDASRANDYLEADKTLREAEKQLSIVMRRCDFEESCDNDESANQQKAVNNDVAKIAQLEQQIARYEAAKAKSLDSHGEQEKKRLTIQFRQLEDQIAAADETKAALLAQKSQLVEDAHGQLADCPEHLADICKQFVPYEDDATKLVESLIAWRKALLAAGPGLPIASLVAQSSLNKVWLSVDVDQRPDWMQLDLQDVESWLTNYRGRH